MNSKNDYYVVSRGFGAPRLSSPYPSASGPYTLTEALRYMSAGRVLVRTVETETEEVIRPRTETVYKVRDE